MNIHALTEQLLSKMEHVDVPKAVSILELRRWSVDELQRRMRKWLRAGGDACATAFDHGEWSVRDDHTLVRLPQGARAELFHASGAFKLSSGLAPMENLFKEMPSVKELAELAEKFIASLAVREQLGRNEALTFERMWKIKAAAEDREGKRTEPVLCRAVGAFRHHVEGLPVYGPASVAVQMAGDGSLDSFTTLLRGPALETLEQAKVLSPERAAKGMLQQLATQFGSSQGAQRVEPEFECKDGLRLGYMSLGKRKAQRLLAPVYVATIDVTHEHESQGLVMVISATEKNYLPLNPPGGDALVSEMGKTAMRKCC